MTPLFQPAQMPGPVRPSKHSRAFAEKYNLHSADPKDFTEEQLGLFEKYKKEQDQERQRRHYEKRVANGTAPRRKLTCELTEEELEKRRDNTSANTAKTYARKQALRNLALDHGLPVPSRINDVTVAQLRDLLRSKLTQDQIDNVEMHALAKFARSPPKRKAADETGARKPGPAKIARLQEEDAAKEASRSAEKLRLFFDANPDIPRVNKVADLTEEQYQRYRSFKRQLDLESYRERERAYDAAHREQRSEAGRRYRLENPEVVRATERKYKQSEKGKAAQRAYEKLDRVKARRATWKRNNAEKTRQYGHDYRARNLNKERARVLRQDALRMGVQYGLTTDEHDNLRQRPCGYCGDVADTTWITQDQMGAGYTPENCIPACKPCAQTKRRFSRNDFVLTMSNIAAVHLEDEEWEFDYGYSDVSKTCAASSYDQYRKNAMAAGRVFEISQSEYDELTADGCFYCLFNESTVGIDRVDNTKGYVKDNVVGCCNRCNEAKGTKTFDQFVNIAVKVYLHVYKNG